eukprot:gene8862-11955_t
MSKSNAVKLTAKWQLDAALLSRPVDLTALVTMSRTSPASFMDDNTLQRLVTVLLNEKNSKKSDKDTKLDVLNILANVAASSKAAVAEVRISLQGISEWFDEYMATEESKPGQEPELNKAMVLLLARCWDYKLKTEDVLELTQGNRKIALCTVVGLLEDGETYSTELKQRQKPGQGKMGQWEHELVCHRYEKPLLLQICRLLRGFTHPGTYFETSSEELALYSVEKFASEMDTLLEITLRSNLVEKLSMALYDCLFELEEDSSVNEGKFDGGYSNSLAEYDHIAVSSVHAFLQNLYFYATENNEEYRRHLLMETLLIPRLVLPYLDRCVIHATILNSRAEAYADMLEGDQVAEMALHNPQLIKGMSASLRTLIIASFRAPSTQFVMTLLRRLNPTAQILRASAFCRHHDYIFALLCLLNVNMGALDLVKSATKVNASRSRDRDDDDEDDLEDSTEDSYANVLLQQLASIYTSMDSVKQGRVCKRVMFSGALPISRDTSSYSAIVSVLNGGAAGQLLYGSADKRDSGFDGSATLGESEFIKDGRAEAKREAAKRMNILRQNDERINQIKIESLNNNDSKSGNNHNHNVSHNANDYGDAQPKLTAFQIAVSVANASENKDYKSDAKQNYDNYPDNEVTRHKNDETAMKNTYRLLGDLPSLGNNDHNKNKSKSRNNAKIALALELPSSNNGNNDYQFMKKDFKSEQTNNSNKPGADPTIPKEFLCAINGHVMKDPVRVKSTGLVFERETIELWLATRGSICPITNTELFKQDLEAADDLRNMIKRYHIQQTSLRSSNLPEDDLYDF